MAISWQLSFTLLFDLSGHDCIGHCLQLKEFGTEGVDVAP
jgi:hypothetical protein